MCSFSPPRRGCGSPGIRVEKLLARRDPVIDRGLISDVMSATIGHDQIAPLGT